MIVIAITSNFQKILIIVIIVISNCNDYNNDFNYGIFIENK